MVVDCLCEEESREWAARGEFGSPQVGIAKGMESQTGGSNKRTRSRDHLWRNRSQPNDRG